jgi:hypothetical protein
MTHVKPEITYIPLKRLSVVWVQSQRPYDPKWAKEIADNLDPDMFDPIIVTKPNGQGIYHIIEGQHRRHGLEMYAAKLSPTGKGDDECAPCRIVADANPARAAKIWLGVNAGRKAVKPIHGFKVAVVAGDEPEVTINNVVESNSFRIAQVKEIDCIAAVTALKTVFNRHGKMTLNNVLRALRQIWKGDPAAVASPMLRGFGIFLHEFGSHVDTKRLATRIGEKWSPYKLAQAAEARKQTSLEKLDEAISELLMREYNKGLKEQSKLLRHKP